MFCKNCGYQLNDESAPCPNCGYFEQPYNQQYTQPGQNNQYWQNTQQNQQYNPYNQPPRNMPAPDDGGFLWGLAGCCVPILGLILFLVWKDERPNTAKAAGIGALISVGLSIAYVVLIFIIGFMGAAGAAYHSGYYHYW